MNNPNVHSTLLALVGAYVLSIAWDFFADLREGTTTMSRGLTAGLAVFFALAGLFVILYAWKVWRDGKKEKPEEKRDDALK